MRRFAYESARLVVRPMRLSDYPAWKRAYTQSRPAQNKWDLGPFTERKCSEEAFKKIVARHRKKATADECYIYGAFNKNGELVGTADIYIFERGMIDFANIGYRIFNRWWGQGYGLELLKTMQKIGHGDLKLRRLEAIIEPVNRRSIGLCRKAGLSREGIRRKFALEGKEWLDHVVYVSVKS